MFNIKFFTIICLFNLCQLIFSENYATDAQFPWHASLVGTYGTGFKKLCGGSIISHQWILTATQCVFQENTILKSLKIGLGSTNLISPKMVFVYNFYNGNYIGRIIIHPDYKPHMKLNDVALIRLRVNFSKYIQAVILPSTQLSFNYETYVNASVKISGFQELYENSIIDHRLKCVKLRIIDNNHCSDYFIEQQIVPSTLCAIGNVTQNLCGADVGSALVIYDKFIGRHIQVGIRSFISINLCDIGVSSYMRITSYLNWINEIIN